MLLCMCIISTKSKNGIMSVVRPNKQRQNKDSLGLSFPTLRLRPILGFIQFQMFQIKSIGCGSYFAKIPVRLQNRYNQISEARKPYILDFILHSTWSHMQRSLLTSLFQTSKFRLGRLVSLRKNISCFAVAKSHKDDMNNAITPESHPLNQNHFINLGTSASTDIIQN